MHQGLQILAGRKVLTESVEDDDVFAISADRGIRKV